MEKSRLLTLQEMDPRIWSQLPLDLLEHVLSHLPLKHFLKLRSTCKHFKNLLFSPSFISRHLSAKSSLPLSFLLLSHPQFHHRYTLFDTVLNNWRSLSLSPSLTRPCKSPSSELLSASNGLLCFSHPNTLSLVVCNLLTRSSTVVKFPKLPFSFELLTLVSTSQGGYKLFMLSSFGSSNQALVYDSRACSWNQFEGVRPFFSENCNQEGVIYNGCLYFITTEPFDTICFDLENGSWDRSTIVLPDGLTFARFCSDGGSKLYLIGGCGRRGISRRMKLWELRDEHAWIEVETMPEMMCRKFLSVTYHKYEHVYCFWHQGLICVCCYNWPEVLYYKVSRRTWHWVPKCPSLPEKWSCGFKWFSFVPELYAIA